MSAARFLTDLFESGRVSVDQGALELDEEVDALLCSAERTRAENLAGSTPRFNLPVARWATALFYRACQFVVCRDTDAKTIEAAFQEKCPESHSPVTDYSADLVLQYLPELIGMTRAVASGDPLLQQLLQLAREWPLSCVGVADIGKVDVQSFINHPCLRQLYADRIIERTDLSRLGASAVDNCVRETLGAFPELCKPIGRFFESSPQAGARAGGTSEK